MGNIVNNPNSKNNEFKRKTVFDKKIIDILKNVTTVNDTNIPNIPTFKDPITGKNIYYKHQMQACCVNALYPKDKLPADTDTALLNDPTSYLRIPLPVLNNVDCSDPAKINKIDQEMCLNTADVNIAFEDMNKDGKPLCPTELDISYDGPNATTGAPVCDSLINNICAKELYEQNCMYVSGYDKDGKAINKWNINNPMCNISSRTNLSQPFVGSAICACSNSQLGPNTNTNPSKNLSDKLGNAYNINSNNLTAQTDTPYSLNVNNNSKTIYPKHLDTICTTGLNNGGVHTKLQMIMKLLIYV